MHRPISLFRTAVPLLALGSLATGISACFGPDDGYPYLDPMTQPVTVTAEPPPAISGGTLMIARDGHTAVVADPDRDVIWIVELNTKDIASIPLQHHDEPGRVVEDDHGHAHVALRRSGDLVTIDIATRTLLERRAVCPGPRGLAYDELSDNVHVACAGGELVTLPASGGPAVRKLRLDRDLRDIVIDGDKLIISRFRSAETLIVGADGQVEKKRALPQFIDGTSVEYLPTVAWRMVKRPTGGAVMVHQRSMKSQVTLATAGGYYGSAAGCTGNIVHGAISLIDRATAPDPTETPPATAAIPTVSLPVDIAFSGTRIAVVAAGNDTVIHTAVDQVLADAIAGNCFPNINAEPTSGQPIAVAFNGDGNIVAQLREPAGIQVLGHRPILFPADSMRDTGHEMFHRSPNGFSMIACASCHPEGLDDSHTWNFDKFGLRRTQAIGGGILKTAPLHWSGDQEDLTHLMNEVFVNRMSGPRVGKRLVNLIGRFIDSVPAFPASPPDDPAAAARGEALFFDAKVGCADCHSGSMFTNNLNKDIGKGEPLQVPTLIGISGRAPFMHDGCAATLRDRFDPACGGTNHGNIADLTPEQIDDLVAYLDTL